MDCMVSDLPHYINHVQPFLWHSPSLNRIWEVLVSEVKYVCNLFAKGWPFKGMSDLQYRFGLRDQRLPLDQNISNGLKVIPQLAETETAKQSAKGKLNT